MDIYFAKSAPKKIFLNPLVTRTGVWYNAHRWKRFTPEWVTNFGNKTKEKTMKKLITTAIVAAAAFGAFAIETGVRFEELSRGATTIDDLNEITGSYWSSTGADNTYEVYDWVGEAKASYAHPAPWAPEGVQSSTNALSIKTTFGQPLQFAVNENNATANMGIYFDSLVKFTVCEEAPETDYSDAKIVMWLQEVYDEETDDVTATNLMVKAGFLSIGDNGVEVSNAVYTAGNQLIDGAFADKWHRVTIKTIADITDGSGIPGFAIYIDGNNEGAVAISSGVAKWDDTFTYALSEAAEYLKDTGCLFPSMVQGLATGKSTITAVQFDGTGSINELQFTATAPAFAEDYVDPKATILVGGNDVGSGYNLGTFAGIVEAVNAEAAKGTDGAEVAIKVTLSAGLELDAPVEIEYNEYASVELDFNGVILTNNVASCIITNNAILTVTDSVGTGGIYANVPNQEGGAIYQGESGFLTISNGNFWANIDIGTSVSVEIAGGSFQQNEEVFSYEDPDTHEIGYLIAQNKWFFADGEGWYTVDDAYTVTFDPNGAEVVIPSQKVRSGSSKADVLANVNPERAGYTLSGWLMEPDAETITADTTFTAQWEAVATPTYTIAVGAPGTGVSVAVVTNGVAAGSAEGDYVVNAGESATVTYSAQAGYQLADGATAVFMFENIAANQTTTAPRAQAIQYTITYTLVAESASGIGAAPAAGSYTVESETVTLTQPAAVTGYTFSGWYAAQDLSGTAVTEFMVDANNLAAKTFYGKFTASATPVIPEGSSSVEFAGEAGNADEIAASVKIAVPAAATQAGVTDATYQGYFTKTATYNDGKWTVTAEIAETVKQAVAESATAVFEGDSGNVAVPAGLYYKITTMTGVDGTGAGTPEKGISYGDAIPVTKPGTSAGFIKIQLGTQAFE